MGRYSIKDIELLTGIKAHTIRIWEQRYSIPLPKRTETNIRYYDDNDLKLLLNISLLNHNGHKISEIIRLNAKEISDLIVTYSLQTEKHPVIIQTMISSMIELDEIAFERTLSTCILQLGLENTMMDVVFPFLGAIGVMWQTGTINPAYEHFITNLIRQKLIVAIEGQPLRKDVAGKKFLLFLPETELHELGLLFGNYMIRKAGHHTIYLGQNVPLIDVEKIGLRYQPDYIIVSMTTTYTLEFASEMLTALRDKFQSSRVLVTGRFFNQYPDMVGVGMEVIKQPVDLSKYF
jgi:DNA-binding transcriptional MerR regulator